LLSSGAWSVPVVIVELFLVLLLQFL
jgi:hypothetical protein